MTAILPLRQMDYTCKWDQESLHILYNIEIILNDMYKIYKTGGSTRYIFRVTGTPSMEEITGE